MCGHRRLRLPRQADQQETRHRPKTGTGLSKLAGPGWLCGNNLAETTCAAALLFAMIKRFREYSFLLPCYHCECSQSGRG